MAGADKRLAAQAMVAKCGGGYLICMNDADRLRALRAELIRDFRPSAKIYWADFLASTASAWLATVGAMVLSGPSLLHLLFVPVAVLASYRASYFVHEICHQRRALFGLETAYNLLVGAWVMVPSFMADSHVDHHRLSTYGTERDPEYERVATFSGARIVLSILVMPIVPLLLALRFGVLAPLSWLIPPLRTLVLERASSMATNASYVRDAKAARTARTVVQEAMAALVVIGVSLAIVEGLLPLRVALLWWLVTGLAFTVNQARTQIAHAYENDGRTLSLAEQVADSTSIRAPKWWTVLLFPLGNEYHALHHLAPSLPYHALAAAHARLVSLAPAAYQASVQDGLVPGLRAILNRAASRRSTFAAPRV